MNEAKGSKEFGNPSNILKDQKNFNDFNIEDQLNSIYRPEKVKQTLPKPQQISFPKDITPKSSFQKQKSSIVEDSLSGISFSAHISPSELGLSQSIKAEIPKEDRKEIVAETFRNHKLLQSFFDSWIKFTHEEREMNVRDLIFQRKQNMIMMRKFFNKMRDKHEINEKLSEIGLKLRITKHFMMWKRITDEESLRREKFLRFLLARRNIYERIYFKEWINAYNKGIKAINNMQKVEQNLLQKAFNCLRYNVRMNREERDNENQVEMVRSLYLQKRQFDMWKYSMKLRRLKNTCIRKLRFVKLEIYFDIWLSRKQKRDKQQNKVTNIFAFVREHRMRTALYKWIDKYNEHMDVKMRASKVFKKRKKKVFDKFFYLWINQFNVVNYLHKKEEQIILMRIKLNKRKYFGIWLSKYHQITHRNEFFDAAEEEFILWKENRIFYIWKSNFYFAKYTRIKANRLKRKLNKSKLQRAFAKWSLSFHQHMKERFNEEQANKYRDLSLKLKAFSRIKAYNNEIRLLKNKIYRARKYRYEKLKRKAMASWVYNHNVIYRRCFLVTSVLKSWAEASKKKRFDAWRKYALDQKQKRFDEIQVFQTYKERNFQFAMTCFIVGSRLRPKITQQPNKPTVEEILASDSSITYDSDPLKSDDSDDDNLPIRQSIDQNLLKLPNRPVFLPQKPVMN